MSHKALYWDHYSSWHTSMTSLTVSVDSSETKLFTDASLIFRMINSQQDADYLQKDLTALEKWEREWQMSVRPEKCTVVRIHATKNSVINTTYTMYNQVLQTTDSSKNLGVTLSDDLTWQKHVDITTSKVKKGKDQESIQSSTTPDPGYQLDITNESQGVSHFPAGDHRASINRRTRKHNKNKTEIT